MLDEVEVGRRYKGCGRSTACLALVTTGICLALTVTSKPCSTLYPSQSGFCPSHMCARGGDPPHTFA
jgi:hypothetical protein